MAQFFLFIYSQQFVNSLCVSFPSRSVFFSSFALIFVPFSSVSICWVCVDSVSWKRLSKKNREANNRNTYERKKRVKNAHLSRLQMVWQMCENQHKFNILVKRYRAHEWVNWWGSSNDSDKNINSNARCDSIVSTAVSFSKVEWLLQYGPAHLT